MIDPAHYEGRGQALVKHTFLDRYMRDQLPKVSRFGTVVYVDLFSGPWQSRSVDYSDTSFGIALRRMAEAKSVQAKLGRDVRMVAHLVEKENYDELVRAAALFTGIEVHCYHGLAEQHSAAITKAIPSGAFRFVVIDPKGLPDVRDFSSLIAAPRCEVLVNFMFQFANRFLATNRMPKLVEWLGQVAPGPDWQEKVDRLSGEERERFITNMARDALAAIGGWQYAPAITVDETDCDRPLYKLIYLSQHHLGLKLFRDAQVAALDVQSSERTKAKAAKTEERTRIRDMFADAGLTDPNERSALTIAKGRKAAIAFAREAIRQAGPEGITWRKLWTGVLDAWVITHKELGDIVVGWQRSGDVTIPALVRPLRKPKDDHLIFGA